MFFSVPPYLQPLLFAFPFFFRSSMVVSQNTVLFSHRGKQIEVDDVIYL